MMRSVGELAKRLRNMQAETKHRAQKLVALCAENAASEARRLVPVDTGMLKECISSRAYGADEAAVIADSPYAAHVEFGTTRMAAQPFLLPAAQLQFDRLAKDAGHIWNKGGRI